VQLDVAVLACARSCAILTLARKLLGHGGDWRREMMNLTAAILGIALLGAASYAAAWQLREGPQDDSCEQTPK
jgi:hypothetical protein